MNILSREKQIAIISALTEGLGIRDTARVTETAVSLCGALQHVLGSRSPKTTPAVTLGITDHAWSIGELIDQARKHQTQ